MQTTAYTVELENFSGPLNVLLQLIQRQKLDICEINLATVTKDYLFFMQNTQLDQHSANSFLEIAVRLILFKSKALLPSEEATQSEEEIEDLTEQLKLLALYQNTFIQLNSSGENGLVRRRQQTKELANTVYTNVSVQTLYKAMCNLKLEKKPPKIFKLKRKNNQLLRSQLLKRLKSLKNIQLTEISTLGQSKQETVMLFMIILELINKNNASLSTHSGQSTIEVLA